LFFDLRTKMGIRQIVGGSVMTAEEIWRLKPDKELRAAARRLSEYTDMGQRVIVAEIARRKTPEYLASQEGAERRLDGRADDWDSGGAKTLRGMALAFLLADVPACFSLVATQAATGRESIVGVVVLYCVGWFVLFLGGSAAGLGVAGVTGKTLRMGVLGCAGGGATAALIALVLLSIGGSLEVLAVPLFLPWMVGWMVVRLTV
jgi:hypothetical protein